MKFYYAGNFINMGDVSKEVEFVEQIKPYIEEYNRLSSFYFKQTENLLTLKEREIRDDKNSKK